MLQPLAFLRGVLGKCGPAVLQLLRGASRAAIAHGFLREPSHLGYEDGELLPTSRRAPRLIFPDAPRVPTSSLLMLEAETGDAKTQSRGGRAMFPAPAWTVGASGPNVPGEARAHQLYPKLLDYEWDILFDAHELDTPSGQKVIAGAAFNDCSTHLRRSGVLDLMGKPTELGFDLIAMKKAGWAQPT